LRAGAIETASITGYIAAIRAYARTIDGDMAQAALLARQALDVLPTQELLARGLAAEQLSTALYWTGDLATAEEALAGAASANQSAGESQTQVLLLCHLAALQGELGRLRQAAATFRQAIALARQGADKGGRPLSAAGFATLRLSHVLLEWNQLDEALRLAREGIAQCEQWGWADGLVFGYGDLALVLQAVGERDAAREATSKGLRIAEGAPFLIEYIAAIGARVAIEQGDLAAAGAWASRRNLRPDVEVDFQRKHVYSTYVRLLLAKGKLNASLELIDRFLSVVEAAGANSTVIELLALRARALAELGTDDKGRCEGARQSLERALQLAEGAGFVRSFMHHGPAFVRILEMAANEGAFSDYARGLLDATRREAAGGPAPVRDAGVPRQEGLIEALSQRECQVLRLLASHLSTPEMADVLIISTHTVRSHVKNIYGKLGVHSRLEAVDRARELVPI
jgi:LuxR family maltose regulon positive regulatory protein